MSRHLVKRSLVLSGHGTSVALEAEFWDVLCRIATARDLSLAALVAEIDSRRAETQPLSSALRVAALLAHPDMTNRPEK